MRALGLAVLVLSLAGCQSTMGKITPHEFTAVSGETIIACEVEGWTFAVGDGGVCRVDDTGYVSTTEGGRVSETFRDLTLGLVEGVGRVVGGLFGGIGGAFTAIGQGASGDGS